MFYYHILPLAPSLVNPSDKKHHFTTILVLVSVSSGVEKRTCVIWPIALKPTARMGLIVVLISFV